MKTRPELAELNGEVDAKSNGTIPQIKTISGYFLKPLTKTV
jgi:hypothetical protein